MVSKADRMAEKGVSLSALISDVVMVNYSFLLRFRVVTVRSSLTKVIVSRIIEEPDAAGQGGRAPSS